MLYLLRFSKPLGDPSRPGAHASYYLGWCPDTPHGLRYRVRKHRTGRGARITAAAVQKGATLTVVRTWPGLGRDAERRMKQRGHFRDLDPSTQR